MARLNLSDYTIATLESLRAEREQHYTQRNTWFDEYEKVYLGSDMWTEEAREEEERISLPTGFDIVEMMTSLMTARQPQIAIPPERESRKAQRRADAVELFLTACWEQAQLFPAFHDAVWHGGALGWMVIRTTWDDEALACGELPIVYQSIYPRNIYPMFDYRGRLAYLFFVEERLVSSIRTEWQGALKGMPADQTVEYVEYWGAVRDKGGKKITHAVYANQVWIKKPRNVTEIYPDIPYTVSPVQSIPIPGKGEYEGVSILYPISMPDKPKTSLVRYRNRLASQMAQTVTDYADPVRIVKTDDINMTTGQANVPFDTTHGAVNTLRAQEDAYYLQWQGNPPAIYNHWQMIENEISRATFPPAIFGEYSTDISGIALNVLTTPTMARLASRQFNVRTMLQDVMSFTLRLVEQNMPSEGIPFWVSVNNQYREDTLKKSDIGGYYRVQVRLSADLPKDIPGMLAMIAQLRSARLISQFTGINMVQQMLDTMRQSPDEEINKIVQEELLLSEPLKTAMATEAARQYGLPPGVEVPQERGTPGPEPGPRALPGELMAPAAAPFQPGIEPEAAARLMGLPAAPQGGFGPSTPGLPGPGGA